MTSVNNGNWKFKFSKTELRTAIIINLMLDCKKHNQKNLKEKFNLLYNNRAKSFQNAGNRIINRYLESCGEISDSAVSRIVTELEDKIIKREDGKKVRGTTPILNSLLQEPDALKNILNIFHESKLPHAVYLWIGFKIINSEYGKKLINKELVVSTFKRYIDKNEKPLFKEDEINKILKILKISPTALLKVLNKYYLPYRNPFVYGDIDKVKKAILTDLLVSLGEDIIEEGFYPDEPIEYKIILNLNTIEKLKNEELESNDYKIEGNDIEIRIDPRFGNN